MERSRLALVTAGFLTFSTIGSYGQNLILNGDFEEYRSCPKAPGDFELCKYWYLANSSTPDYFRKCTEGSAAFNVPYNHAGIQEPHSGNGYIGLFLISGANKNHREYVQGELTEKLITGTKYVISFYISWADFSSTFCDRVGFSFSSNKIVPGEKSTWNYKKLLKSSGYCLLQLDSLKERTTWHQIRLEYIAKGDEKYLVIGVFDDNLSQNHFDRLISKGYLNKYGKEKKEAYFFLDDLSVSVAKKNIKFSHEP